MDKIQAFQEFLTTQQVEIPLLRFVLNLIISAVLSLALGWVYIRFGRSLSNRKAFAWNFVIISMTTMLIISIVKASLALSLGLVGALSIVRFRAAIKEPEELAFLFLNIAIGLGLGADQGFTTFIAFLIIIGFVIARGMLYRKDESQNMYLSISLEHENTKEKLDAIVDILSRHCRMVKLKRLDEAGNTMEAAFLVEMDDYNQLSQSREELKVLDSKIKLSFLDNRTSS